MYSGTTIESSRSQTESKLEHYLPLILVIIVVLVVRAPAVRTWWCLDDWGLIARAEGLSSDVIEYPARWISQSVWWRIVVPLFGLNAFPHAVLRMALLALGAIAVVRVAEKHGMSPFSRGLAGVLFAATPIAFTPIYWASAVQELLAVVFLLLAYDNWLDSGRRAVSFATAFGILSILSKEPGLCLPLVLIAVPELRPGRRDNVALRRAAVGVLFAVAIFESLLVLRHFSTDTGAPYEIGGTKTVIGNVGTFGWWLATIGSRYVGQMDWGRAAIGMGVILVWLLLSCYRQWRGWGPALTLFVFALTTLLPALPLLKQARPYMALGAAAFFYVAIAEWLPRWGGKRVIWLVPLATIAAFSGNAAMRERMMPEHVVGTSVDPVVRAAHLSQKACEVIQADLAASPLPGGGRIVVYQQPLRSRDRRSVPLVKTALYSALGGDLGPAIIARQDRPAHWTTSIETVGASSRVYCETKDGLEAWGDAWNARVNAALLFIFVGNFERATDCLNAAIRETHTIAEYRYMAELLQMPIDPFLGRADEYRSYLHRAATVGILQRDAAETLARQVSVLVAKVLEAGASPPARSRPTANPGRAG